MVLSPMTVLKASVMTVVEYHSDSYIQMNILKGFLITARLFDWELSNIWHIFALEPCRSIEF